MKLSIIHLSAFCLLVLLVGETGGFGGKYGPISFDSRKAKDQKLFKSLTVKKGKISLGVLQY